MRRPTPRIFSPSWWVRGRDGRIVLAQAPNPAILVWLFSVVIGWTDLLDHRREAILILVGQGALLVWALDEVFRGASPVRRVLGVVVLVVVLVQLFG